MHAKGKATSGRTGLGNMLAVDLRRMFTTRLLYIMIGVCLVVPILILVMTTMVGGSVVTDPQTGVETTVEGFQNAWQIIGTISGDGSAMAMDMTSMCNMNLLYFAAAVFVCLFVTEDFKSGYAKNLFAVRARKRGYVRSKIIAGLAGGALMLLAFFVGSMLGGAFAGLPFTLESVSVGNIILCLLAKLFMLGVFVPIAVAVSVYARQKTWLGIVGSCGAGMLLFMIVPMMTPLNATALHALLCLAGGALFCAGLGSVGSMILSREDLVV